MKTKGTKRRRPSGPHARRRRALPWPEDRTGSVIDSRQALRTTLRAQTLEAVVASDEHIVPLLILTRHGVVRSINDAALEFFGLEADQIIFRPFAELLSPSDAVRFSRFVNHAADHARTQGDFVVRTAREPVSVQVLLQTNGAAELGQPFFRAALVDLRPNSESLPWLDERRPDYRDLLHTIDGVVWKAEYPTRFTFVSEQCQRILGYSPLDWIGDPDFWEKKMFCDDREKVVRARELAIRKRNAHVLEYRMLTADRDLIWVRDSATVSRDDDGKVTLAGIISDITELKRAQENLLHNQAKLEQAVQERTARLHESVRSMELFCYGIAHDLKAPLRAMSAYSELLAEQFPRQLGETGHDYVMRIARAARHFGSLIESLLRYGRLNHEGIACEGVDLRTACTRAIELLSDDVKARHAKIRLHCGSLAVWADPTLVQEIFVNLIGNALKFSRPKVRPEISIDARAAQGGEANDSAVRVSVTDNGIGIQEEDVGKVFEVFQRLRPSLNVPGTGIGLALVKRALELMNGRVGVYSRPNQGSTFWFELPPARIKRITRTGTFASDPPRLLAGC
jgi:PAS domain S-box-containing protein